MNECRLCAISFDEPDQGRLIRVTDLAYSVMNIEPLHPGHVMVIPRRHSTLRDLTSEELVALTKEVVRLTDRLCFLYLDGHPLIWTVSDTQHASIPTHFHYHLTPSEKGMRVLMGSYYNTSPRQRAVAEDLEKLAAQLR